MSKKKGGGIEATQIDSNKKYPMLVVGDDVDNSLSSFDNNTPIVCIVLSDRCSKKSLVQLY